MEIIAKSYLSKYAILLCVMVVFTLMSVKESAASLHYKASTKTGLLFWHRKFYLEKKKLGFKISGMPEVGGYGNLETPEEWELRKVPAGPNPLHHNGRDPTKPRTP